MLCMYYDGLKGVLLRRTMPELRNNHITPLRSELYGYAKYNQEERAFLFPNGSRLMLGYCDNEGDLLQYQGQEYDVIFLEEATQFSELVFNVLKACLRGANNFPKRMYLTCNPDGIGFLWVKRLFVTRKYKEGENPEEYRFIQSLVDDNRILMEMNPDYVKQLDSLPDAQTVALWLLGCCRRTVF